MRVKKNTSWIGNYFVKDLEIFFLFPDWQYPSLPGNNECSGITMSYLGTAVGILPTGQDGMDGEGAK